MRANCFRSKCLKYFLLHGKEMQRSKFGEDLSISLNHITILSTDAGRKDGRTPDTISAMQCIGQTMICLTCAQISMSVQRTCTIVAKMQHVTIRKAVLTAAAEPVTMVMASAVMVNFNFFSKLFLYHCTDVRTPIICVRTYGKMSTAYFLHLLYVWSHVGRSTVSPVHHITLASGSGGL